LQLQIRRLALDIRGLTVSRAYRSHASMIHFHFGPLQEWYRRDGQARYRGAYGLMIELAAWTITRHGATLATDASSYERIDRALLSFPGRRIVCVCVSRATVPNWDLKMACGSAFRPAARRGDHGTRYRTKPHFATRLRR
jgi:hypothetical protein